MKLAEEIIVVLADKAVELRPSLRHAIRLERRQGGFRQLIQDIRDGSLDAAVAIIEPHFNEGFIESRVFDALPDIKPDLISYVLSCAGMDAESGAARENEGEKPTNTRPFADHLVDLYKHGTGWLGWTPEATLDATPIEITKAFEGHLAMLRAIHGGSEPAEKDERPLEDKFRSVFAGIGTMKVEA